MPRSGEPNKEHALVLRAIRHSESSRIVTLFSNKRGKFAVIAKGARRSGKGSSPSLTEPPSLLECMVYFKNNRSVQTLGAASSLESYPHIRSEVVLTGYVSALLQILDHTLSDGEPNEHAFNAARLTLHEWEHGLGDPRIRLWDFLLELFNAIGFGLDPNLCPICGANPAKIDRKNSLLIESGAICCAKCSPNNSNCITVTGEAVGLLRRIYNGPKNGLHLLKPSAAVRKDLTAGLITYLKHHLPDIGELKALSILNQLEQ